VNLPAVALAARLLLAGGPYHAEEVGDKPSRGWWVLSGTNAGNVTWAPGVPRFKPVLDAVLDRDPAKPTGVQISVAARNPIFLGRELRIAGQGRVATHFFRPEGIDIRKPLPNLPFQLQVMSTPGNRRPSLLVLVGKGDRRQTIYSWPEGITEDLTASLVWAGDLDQDGKLDLYMILSRHYNEAVHTLFLSSRARGSDLVGTAAVFRVTGC